MAAIDTYYINNKIAVRRYEQSVNMQGRVIYFGHTLTDAAWHDFLTALSHLAATVHNYAVDEIRNEIKDVLGIDHE